MVFPSLGSRATIISPAFGLKKIFTNNNSIPVLQCSKHAISIDFTFNKKGGIINHKLTLYPVILAKAGDSLKWIAPLW